MPGERVPDGTYNYDIDKEILTIQFARTWFNALDSCYSAQSAFILATENIVNSKEKFIHLSGIEINKFDINRYVICAVNTDKKYINNNQYIELNTKITSDIIKNVKDYMSCIIEYIPCRFKNSNSNEAYFTYNYNKSHDYDRELLGLLKKRLLTVNEYEKFMSIHRNAVLHVFIKNIYIIDKRSNKVIKSIKIDRRT
jgi:hypothetical protein